MNRMSLVLTLLRFAALLVSLLGYVGFARAFCKIPRYISILFCLSLIGLAIFFSGLVHVMRPMAYGIFGIGIVLLLVVLFTRKAGVAYPKPYLQAVTIFFLLWFGLVFAVLINSRFTSYDDYSHWAVVVKHLLITDEFPTAKASLTTFTNYPLGTASFLYYVCVIVGHGDGVMLVGQTMLIMACFYALYGVLQGKQPSILLVALLALVIAMIHYDSVGTSFGDLHVDQLLPLLALGTIAGIMECDHKQWLTVLITIPILGLLVLVKRTGAIFAIPPILFLLYQTRQNGKAKQTGQRLLAWLETTAGLLIVLFCYLVWQKHVDDVFFGTYNKFTIGLNTLSTLDVHNLSALIPDMSPENIRQIVATFFGMVFSFANPITQSFLRINVLAILSYSIARFVFGRRWKLLRVLLLLDALMLIYYGFLLVFYIFGMEKGEALILAGFNRYAASMLTFVIGGVGLRAVRDVADSLPAQSVATFRLTDVNTRKKLAVYGIATLLAFLVCGGLLTQDLVTIRARKNTFADSLTAKAESVLGNRWDALDQNWYLLYAPPTNKLMKNAFLLYIGMYDLCAPRMYITSAVDDNLKQWVLDSDYFVIVESDDAIRTWMQTQTSLSGEPGIYRVDQVF